MDLQEKFVVDELFLAKRPLSYSSLKAFMKSPAHYKYYITAPKPEPTDALRMGQLIDLVLLSPDKVESEVAVLPAINRRSNVGKEEYAAFVASHENKLIVTAEQMLNAELIRDAVYKNPTAMYYFGQVTQTQRKFTCDINGLPFIGFKDMVGPKFIIDLKSTKSAYEPDFNRDIFSYGYDLQAAIYVTGERDYPDYYILAVEKEEPFGCAVFRLSGEIVDAAKAQLDMVIDNFKFCMAENAWDRSYDFWQASGIFQPRLPYWKRN